MKIVDPKNKIVERPLQKQETESKIARIKQKKVKGRTIQIQINYKSYILMVTGKIISNIR